MRSPSTHQAAAHLHEPVLRGVFSLCLLLCVLLFCGSATGQETESIGELGADLLNLKIDEVQSSASLEEEVATELLDLYRQALSNLERVRVEQAKTESIIDAANRAPESLARLRSELEELSAKDTDDTGENTDSLSLEALEPQLSEIKIRVTEAESRLSGLNEELSGELLRPTQIRERLGQARRERDASNDELSASSGAGTADQLSEARRWNLLASNRALNAEIRRLEQELLSHSVRIDVLNAERDVAVAEAEHYRAQARMLEDAIGVKRADKARLARQEAVAARSQVSSENPVVREFATRNVELGSRLTQRTADVQQSASQRDSTQQEVARLEQELNQTQSKLEIAGLRQALGRQMLDNRRALPSLGQLRKLRRETLNLMSDVGLEGLMLEEQKRDLRNPEQFIEELTADLDPQEAADSRDELNELINNRLELIETAIRTDTRYMQILGELDVAQAQLEDVVARYDDFLASRLLWVRTTAPMTLHTFANLPTEIAWQLSPANWYGFIRDLVSGAWAKWPLILLLSLLVALGVTRSRLVRHLEACAAPVGRIGEDRFVFSIRALLLTLALAAPWPLVIMVVGAATEVVATPGGFSDSIATTLAIIGFDLLMIQFFLDASRDRGLLQKHCNWPDFTVSRLRSELKWFRIVFPLTTLVVGASLQFETTTSVGGLTIIGSAVGAIALTVLIVKLFFPDGGILRSHFRKHPSTLLAQTRPIWLGALAAVMPLLVGLGIAGYSYTASVLAKSYVFSFWVVLALMTLQGLLARWLLLTYQRLEYETSLERWERERLERQAALRNSDQRQGHEEADLDVEEPRIDFAALNKDGRTLLKAIIFFVGAFWLWLIWAPIVPALDVLENFALWTYTDTSGGTSVERAVTLVDLIFAVLLGIAAGVAAKGLPALVEIVLLRRTDLSASGRYTTTTLLRYTIIGVGVVLVVSMLGVSWSKAQWLVAALGVGIGFGLQEIVANFVSGLIILFERPVRVGDLVTVGETSGVVSRIQIRATTIRDFDRKEMLVPNKELITMRLLNWTLSDQVTRLVIPVGVHYDSDVVEAMKLAEEAAREHSEVLDDPSPFVILEGFGDNALNISLRVYLPNLDNRLTTLSELLTSIRDKYDSAGIVIAYPQRDIHLSTPRPIDVRVQDGKDLPCD